jgi:hypothetical protein
MPYGTSERTKSIWKIATATAQKAGFDSFKEGSPGASKRKHIAEALDKKKRTSFGFKK